MHTLSLEIGGLVFRLETPEPVLVDTELEPFVCNGDPDIRVRYLWDPLTAETTVSVDGSTVTVSCGPASADWLTTTRGCLMQLPMEQLLLNRDRFILHASLVASSWGGLLFSADSGVGKSTQADLWHTYRGGRVINGDRAILSREKPWRAYGSVYAGSSGYFVRESCPIAAVILLEQGKENRAWTATKGEAFRLLLLQSGVDRKNPGDVDKLCDLLTDLIGSVPVYRLACTPDSRAVDALEAALEGGMAHG